MLMPMFVNLDETELNNLAIEMSILVADAMVAHIGCEDQVALMADALSVMEEIGRVSPKF